MIALIKSFGKKVTTELNVVLDCFSLNEGAEHYQNKVDDISADAECIGCFDLISHISEDLINSALNKINPQVGFSSFQIVYNPYDVQKGQPLYNITRVYIIG